jgi:dimethylhistidine N-methyltransferase
LFNQICEQPEYYPTRTELQITRDHADEIAAAIGAGCVLVEYGSGSSLKTRILLDHLREPTAYVPIDISREHLLRSSRALAASYPGLAVRPVWADYTGEFHLPTIDGRERRRGGRVVAYFPGSTIGNFEPTEARQFLESVRRVCGRGGSLLIGVDLKKDPSLLNAAYNDAAGVTAAFNLNLLTRINRELGANFDTSAFEHHAFFNAAAGRVEMHLVSRRRQRVELGDGASISFEPGETIHTENCYKYTLASFRALAAEAGYRPEQVWTDEAGWFSVHYLHG